MGVRTHARGRGRPGNPPRLGALVWPAGRVPTLPSA